MVFARVGFTARNHLSHQSRTSRAPHLLWKAQWGWKKPSHGFVFWNFPCTRRVWPTESDVEMSNPGRRFPTWAFPGMPTIALPIQAAFFLTAGWEAECFFCLPYGNLTVCEQEHRHFEEVNHRISLWFNSLLLKFIIYNRQIIMNHRIKW